MTSNSILKVVHIVVNATLGSFIVWNLYKINENLFLLNENFESMTDIKNLFFKK